MDEIYRSQFRLPFSLYESLKAASEKNHRSVNAELVARLEESFAADQKQSPAHQESPAIHDPAMGSGSFLTSASQVLQELIAMAKQMDEEKAEKRSKSSGDGASISLERRAHKRLTSAKKPVRKETE